MTLVLYFLTLWFAINSLSWNLNTTNYAHFTAN